MIPPLVFHRNNAIIASLCHRAVGNILLVKYNYSDQKLAVIGCGNWGKNHVRVLHALGALYTICDINPTHITALKDQFTLLDSSLEEILMSPNITGCVIVTPARTHFELAKRCLAANKHVFIEKPFTLSTKDAIYLAKFSQEHRRLLMVGHLLHYHNAFSELLSTIRSGAIGHILHVTTERCTFGKFSTEKSVFWDLAPHDVSMILAIMGEMPSKVFATAANHLPGRTHDTAYIELWFSEGRRAQIKLSWVYPVKKQSVTVIGDRAMISFDDTQPWENKLQFFDASRILPATPEARVLTPSEPLMNECKHFIECMIDHQTPKTGHEEGLSVVRVIEAAVHSANILLPVFLNAELTDTEIVNTKTVNME